MSYSNTWLDLLDLNQQHGYHLSELARAHRTLSKEYWKLARIESDLAEPYRTRLTRKDKKKLQWSRAITKKAVCDLESLLLWLHQYLRQRNNQIASLGRTTYSMPFTPWPARMPLLYPLTPRSDVDMVTSWPVNASTRQSPVIGQHFQEPQYWNLSMLPERCEPEGSGFHELPVDAQHFVLDNFGGPNPVYAYELIPHPSNEIPAVIARYSYREGNNEAPELETPAGTGAEPASRHRRRYFENAIQLMESRLPAHPSSHSGANASGIPALSRTVSDHASVARSNVAWSNTG